MTAEAKMDAALKAKWVNALRSGEYKQGRKQLRDGDMFCCLGVLCEVAGLPMDDRGVWPCRDGQIGYAPIWSIVGSEHRRLPEMNDKGNSFSELADYIEQNL